MQNVHPYFIHFPIALLAVGLLWDILGVILKKESLLQAGWWALLFGTVSIIASVTTGLIAAKTVPHTGGAAHEIMEQHETLGLVVASIFVVLLLWRSLMRTKLPSKTLVLVVYMLITIGAVTTMLAGAHLGGRMVYEFGVGGSAVQQSEGTEHHHGEENRSDINEDNTNLHKH